MNNEEDLGQLISSKRKEKNLTQKELAELLHISDKAISRWETNASIPDFKMLQQIGEILDISFKELISYKIDEKDEAVVNAIVKEYEKKTKKIEKNYRKLFLIFLLVVIFLILLIFFRSTFNQFRLYDIAIIGDEYYESVGLYVDTNLQDYIYLGSLNLNKDINMENATADIYIQNGNSKKILKHYDNIANNIKFEIDKSYFKSNSLERYFDNVYIRVNDSNNDQEFIGQLMFTLRFSNNKIFYHINEEIIDNNNDDAFNNIKRKLKELGFKEKTENIYVDASGEFEYYINSNYLSYIYDDSKANLRYNYKYYLENEKLFVVITSFKNSKEIVIEKYNYDAKRDKMNCKVGQCIDYKEILKFLDKYIKKLS